MKKFLLVLVVSLFSLSAMADDNALFVTSSASVASFKNARSVEHIASTGKLRLTYANGVTADFTDASKAIFNKFASSNLKNAYTLAGGKYYRADMAATVTCTGSHTFIGWANVAGEWVDDGCQLFQTIRATAQ